MSKKDDAIQHMSASRIYITTATWAITEFIELVKADLADEFNLRYRRNFLYTPRLFGHQNIKQQVLHEGMSIVLLQPEEKRLIYEHIPDKAIYFSGGVDILPAKTLHELLTTIINRYFDADAAIGREDTQTPFLYYTTQFQKPGNSLKPDELLEEVLITSTNGRIAWIAGLKELVGYCEQLYAPYVYNFPDCPRLKIPRGTPTHNIAIADIIEIPYSGPLSSSSFEMLSTKLDQYLALTRLISAFLIQHLDSEIAHFLMQENRKYPKQISLPSLTQAEAAQMYDVTERTIRNWEKSSESAPPGYPGRDNRSEMELHAKIYLGGKINRSQARAMNRFDARHNNTLESDDPADIAAWNEEQSREQTGKEPEK